MRKISGDRIGAWKEQLLPEMLLASTMLDIVVTPLKFYHFCIKALINATNQQINENYCKRWFESFDLGYFSTMFLQNLKILSHVVEENQLSKPQNWQKLCQMSWSSKLKLVLEENFKVLTFDITKFMA